MSKVDEELTRRLHGAERPVDVDGLFEGLERRRAHRERVRKAQSGLLALAVLAATAGGFVALRAAFDGDARPPGESPSPAIPPRNGEIVFSDRARDGYTHLYAVQPDGSDRRQITDFGTNDTHPSVSPDGGTIAFVHQLEDVSPAIATIPIGGGTPTWLTDPQLFVTDGPSWSPDGTKIAFAAHDDQTQRIYVMEADGSRPRPVTGQDVFWPEGAAWSPDGTLIAFSASPVSGDEEPSVWDIYTVGPDGTGLVNVTQTSDPEGNEFGPAWSPDGRRVAFMAPFEGRDGVWVMPAAGGQAQLVAHAAELEHDLVWAPDGSSLLASDGDWIYRIEVTPPTDARENFLRVVKGSSPAWQPLPPVAATPNPEPSPSPSPDSSDADIGLGFRLCHMARLDGVDFLGDGTAGIAWVGTRMRDDGSCPPEGGGSRAVVAADFHGDELADTWWGGIEDCLYCEPFDATDLDGDGDEELVVLESSSSTPAYVVLTTNPGSNGHPQLRPVVVAAPGHDAARLPAGDLLRISTGGDEGFSGWVRCERYPDAPVLVLTWRDHPIEGATMEVHETKLVLQEDGAAHIIETNDYRAPVGTPIPGVSDAPACGVDWQILG
jgi:dipeptidyl aminopeptidase/acylaminoacyl peptidase